MFEAIKNFLVIDQKTDKISHTKFWSNAGYASLVFAFCYAVVMGMTIEPTMMMMFGGIVVGNRSIVKIASIMSQKFK